MPLDMNMICNTKNSTCKCRETMKWNNETLECQIFINVNCSDLNDSNDLKLEKFDDSFINNLTEFSGKINISEVTSNDTLSSTELSRLNPNKITNVEIKNAFCRDIASVSRFYEEKLTIPNYSTINTVISTIGKLVFIIIVLILIFIWVKSCFICKKKNRANKQVDNYSSSLEDSNLYPQQNVPTALLGTASNPMPTYRHPMFSDPNQLPISPAIPQNQPGYMGYPNNPDPNQLPIGPVIPQNQPGYIGYPNNPDPYANPIYQTNSNQIPNGHAIIPPNQPVYPQYNPDMSVNPIYQADNYINSDQLPIGPAIPPTQPGYQNNPDLIYQDGIVVSQSQSQSQHNNEVPDSSVNSQSQPTPNEASTNNLYPPKPP